MGCNWPFIISLCDVRHQAIAQTDNNSFHEVQYIQTVRHIVTLLLVLLEKFDIVGVGG